MSISSVQESKSNPVSSVLVVDDDDDIRQTLAELLRLTGYQVQEAPNGQAALEVISKQGEPCLVLLDLMMPVMNGWTFLEIARGANSDLKQVPVIVVTALGADVSGLKQRFNCEVVSKPPDIVLLLQLIAKHCGPPYLSRA